MTEERLVVAAPELQILLNTLHDRNQRLQVEYPFYGVPLFSYDPRKGAITSAVKDTEFDDARSRRLPSTKRLADDLPSWGDVRDAMLSSGVLPYANADKIVEGLRRERESAHGAHNPNPTFLAFDTNTLYHRVPSRALQAFGGSTGLQFTVSAAVLGELDIALDQKYSDQDIHTLRSTLVDGKRVASLVNRPVKKGRRAKLALAEVRRLEKAHRSFRSLADPLTPDKEANDRIIAKSYASLRQTARADVVLLTSDHNMQEHALAAGIKPLLLQLPGAAPIPTGPLDERQICRLIHDLAVSFGVLKLVGLDCVIYGDWAGKTPEDSETDNLLIEHPAEGIMKAVRADVETARRIEGLAASVR